MTSAQHARWNRAGRPAQLARPLARLRDRLRAAGCTVYDIGNTTHLDHQPPEDHTPYSETGWPGPSPYGWIMAIDIMPPPAGRGLPSLQTLGRRLVDDRNGGAAPWIKYMNWGPVSDGTAVQDRWMPSYQRRTSSDTGHIHLSIRTDYHASTAFDDYNPLGGTVDLNTVHIGPDGQPRALGTLLAELHNMLVFGAGAQPVVFPKSVPATLDRIAAALEALDPAGPGAGISQEQVDAAVLQAVGTVRFETRAVVPGDE
jgi:hypothetical protein